VSSSSSLRAARLVLAFSLALVAAYLLIWARVSPTDIGRSDFTSTYIGATLFREGHRTDLYAEPLQASLHRALIAPDREGNLPFVDAPLAAVIASPISLLPLDTAYRVWGVAQLLLLLLAAVIAARSAPWPAKTPALWKAAAALVGWSLGGTLALLLQAQWATLPALGLALAYGEWRRQRPAAGAALLVICAGIAKPHLALALVAFMLGWRHRRMLAGVIAGALSVSTASLLAIGFSGAAGFLQLVSATTTRWEYDTFVSFTGLAGSLTGNAPLSPVLGAAGTAAACAVAFWLGALVRARPARLQVGLAGAALCSLLAAPHALVHDLALLTPVASWSIAAALQRTRPAALATIAIAGLVASACGVIALARGGVISAGALFPPVLIVCTVLATRLTLHRPSSESTALPGEGQVHAELAGAS
jgi:Glycosyltransferase family 87